ncbi:MAG TPA: hypothetical protein VKT20_05045 [Candidatus Dormibacteraeota bacterium]|nr:hypothetical protein [Candidatus Dormibacteraeota bacterium]
MVQTTTVLALFRDQRDAETAVKALRSAHFDSAQVGIAHAGDARVPKYGYNAVVGILGGSIGCGLIGALLGLGMTALYPQVFPGGWFVPFMVGLAGAATGAVAGLLISMSMSRQHEMYYEDEVAAGRTLVSVHAEPDRIEQARRILLEEGAFEAAPIDSPLRKAS